MADTYIADHLILEKQAEEAALDAPVDTSYREVPPPAASTGDQWETTFLAQIQGMIATEVARAVSSSLPPAPPAPAPSAGTIPVPLTHPEPTPLPGFTGKHYRNDHNPQAIIQRLDMTALDRGERPQSNPLLGEYIIFRMGHLYTDDPDVIRQLEWMRKRPQLSPDQSQTMGGNPSIYEDDGEGVYHCDQGCVNYHTASRNAWAAHMLSTHQIEVGS